MNNIQFQQASPALRALVRVYAQRDVGAGETQLIESIPARLEQTLEFQFGDSFDVYFADGRHHTAPETVIVGAYPLGGCKIALKKGVSSFGIFFQPAGFLSVVWRTRGGFIPSLLRCTIGNREIYIVLPSAISGRTVVSRPSSACRRVLAEPGNQGLGGRLHDKSYDRPIRRPWHPSHRRPRRSV